MTTPKQNSREELIMNELMDKLLKMTETANNQDIAVLARFILEDRKRIVEPLVKYKDFGKIFNNKMEIYERIDQALKNAGVQS